MSSRDIILQRLRQRTGGPRTVPECDFSVLQRPDWSTAERIDRFRRPSNPCMAKCTCAGKPTGSTGWPVCSGHGGPATCCWAGITRVSEAVRASTHPDLPPLRVYDRPIEQWQPELFNDVDAGLTSTRGGIAETGSLILWPTPDEPRLLSLVPPIHVAVLYASELYPTLYDAMHAQAWAAGMPTNALLISGPSKTADIEQTLAYGVHGPKELIVLVVE